MASHHAGNKGSGGGAGNDSGPARARDQNEIMRKKNLTQKRASLYLRCSTEDQAKGEYTTIDSQREVTRAFAIKRGLTVVGEWVDDGKTGTNLRRAGWRGLLSQAEAGAFEVVVCTYLSRLGRGTVSSVAEHLLSEAGVSVLYAEESFASPSDSEDMGAFVSREATRFGDGMYVQSVRRWTVTKMTAMFHHGYFVGGRIPFGYITVATGEPVDGKAAPRRLSPCPETAPVVRRAFATALESGAASARDSLLRDTGRAWSYKQTVYLLQSRTYIGEAHWRDLTRQNNHPAVVDADLFAAVQERLATASRARTSRAAATHAHVDALPEGNAQGYYLRGLVTCAACGAGMTPKSATGRGGKIVRYYECVRASACVGGMRAENGCVKRINADALQNALIEEVGRMVAVPWRLRTQVEAAVALLPKPQGVAEERTHKQKQLRDVEKKLDRLTEAVAAGGVAAAAAIGRKIGEIDTERTRLTGEIARLTAREAALRAARPSVDTLLGVLSQFTALWHDAARTDTEKEKAMRLLVDAVHVKSKGRAEARLLPSLFPAISSDSSDLRESPLRVRKNRGLREDNGARTHGLESHNLAL